MSRRWLDSEPCVNYRCPHNLFWEEWRLNLDKIQIIEKAFEIRNCCCLINEPWIPGEIGDIWGLTRRRIRHCEAIAWRKVKEECPNKQLKKQLFS